MITAAAIGFFVAFFLWCLNPLFDWWAERSNERSLKRWKKKLGLED